MTQAPDERELLARDLARYSGLEVEHFAKCDFPTIEAFVDADWEDHLPVARHLLSLGWCRRDAVLREAGQALMDARKALLTFWDSEDYEYQEGSVAHALRILDAALFTPQARKEGV